MRPAEEIKKMIQSFVDGKTGTAAELHRQLMPLFSILFVVSNPIPVKYALYQVGFNVGKTRPPLCEPDEKTAKGRPAITARSKPSNASRPVTSACCAILELPAKAIVKASELSKGVRASEAVSDHLALSIDKDSFELFAEGDTDTVNLKLPKNLLVELHAPGKFKIYSPSITLVT
jgi:hypothetical protein